jgi:hypothetical protein
MMPGTWPGITTEPEENHPLTTAITVNPQPVLVDWPKRVRQAVCQWIQRLLQKHPREMVLGMVGLVALLCLWHRHRVHQEWMAVNEIPRSVISELRNRRNRELRWIESLQYGLAQWLEMDRVSLG